MNLNRMWPWKEFRRLESIIVAEEQELMLYRRETTRLQNELNSQLRKHEEKDGHIRKLGTIIAMKGGIAILFMLLCLTGLGQPLDRNPITTNVLALAPANGWFIVSTNGVPVWAINGGLLTNLQPASIVVTPGANGWVLSQSNNVTVWTQNGGGLTNVQITALLPNGTGALTNNGAGLIGWYNFFASLVSPNVFTASNNFTAQLTPSGGITSTNPNFSPVMFWSNTRNTDGNLYVVVSKPTFYQKAVNILTNVSMADSVVIGGEFAAGDDSTGTGAPAFRFGDSIIVGMHCANWVTNANSSVFIGYGAGQGQQSAVGIAPYICDHAIFIGGDVASFYQASNIVNCFFMGSGSGSQFGNGGGMTNCIVLGQNSGVLNGSLNNTNDLIIGNNCELPTGASGEMSIQNLIYAQNMDAHGGGNVGIGPKTPVSKLDVTGIINSSSRVIATNGFASFATNILTTVSSSGFTNDVAHGWGTNTIMVHFIASVGETVTFYMRSGALGQTSCGTLLYTDTGIVTANYPVGVNCGFALSVGTFTSGQAYAYP